eukprot:6173477-Pleurochrysis_carterae.AAC.1
MSYCSVTEIALPTTLLRPGALQTHVISPTHARARVHTGLASVGTCANVTDAGQICLMGPYFLTGNVLSHLDLPREATLSLCVFKKPSAGAPLITTGNDQARSNCPKTCFQQQLQAVDPASLADGRLLLVSN